MLIATLGESVRAPSVARRTHLHASVALILLWARLNCAEAASGLDRDVTLNIEPQSLETALLQFSKQSGVRIMLASSSAGNHTSPGVSGTLRASVALTTLLDDSGLGYKEDGDDVLVRPVGAKQRRIASASDYETAPASSSRTPVSSDTVSGADALLTADSAGDSSSDGKGTGKVQEVVVTGSRLLSQSENRPQEVNVYSRERIDQSGQSTVTDFLNTLPEVSVGSPETGVGALTGGATTVRLHGLPAGNTLVLLNGRRLETSGLFGTSDVFDLNNIPLAAVERIEILPQGSSAVYGSDAIAGVVNIILRSDFKGAEADVKYSSAKDLPEWDTSLALGKKWERGSVSVIGTFVNRGTLLGTERPLSADNDYTAYGGPDERVAFCNLGNVYFPKGYTLNGKSVPYAAVPAGYSGAPTVQEFNGTAGVLNQCSGFAEIPIVPHTRREGAFLEGHYDLTDSIELFTELLYSHTSQQIIHYPPDLYAQGSEYQYTVGASNPYNPFGQAVGVGYSFSSLSSIYSVDTNFFRPLLGIRGSLPNDWTWEAAAWNARDEERYDRPNSVATQALKTALSSNDPNIAINPFGTGPAGSPQLLQSLWADDVYRDVGQTTSASGFVRGSLFSLPGGKVDAVVGAEYNRDMLDTSEIKGGATVPSTAYSRNAYAGFAEVRVPIIGKLDGSSAGNYLSLTAAGRYDHYNDFGGKATPQVGLVWRPFESLTARGSFSKAFKAPPLTYLYQPQISSAGGSVKDPTTGAQEVIPTQVTGGNPNLKAETGKSHSYGLEYASYTFPGFKMSVTQWDDDEINSIQHLSLQNVVTNEALFPQDVIRGPNGNITEVFATYVNFGEVHVEGLDYAASYKLPTRVGDWSASANVTDTYHFTSSITPKAPSVNGVSAGQDSGVWAPRWKGVAAITWGQGSWTAVIDGRYTGEYQDYDATTKIGNFWLFDVNAKYVLDQRSEILRGSYIAGGVRNLFNRAPQYSNFDAGLNGYDPTQADIIGRTFYIQVGAKF